MESIIDTEVSMGYTERRTGEAFEASRCILGPKSTVEEEHSRVYTWVA